MVGVIRMSERKFRMRKRVVVGDRVHAACCVRQPARLPERWQERDTTAN